ncbi:rod shape-determining protein MreC [Duganella qianjiadongensis]|uniref:Cell shape-determining protein MreC n=1 Tax=Duganella qianjiadongensis TaxID=2692176 RepID=A0ABW9VH56_9BURK|nr:rod shape-determining protein MreC [Duganella qianjiadongensis]MYM38825.1 rod shape-determining protein MreC [Duganella qianjiadongensis]
MEYSPPPLFKQGAPARVKMMVFACISIALLLADSRVRTLQTVRKVAGTILYPLQMAALMPRDAIYGVGDYFSSLSALEKQVRELKRQQIASALLLQQAQQRVAENNQLRRLIDAREHLPIKSMLAEILYDARDVNSRKIILDRGSQQGLVLGLPVIDHQGVVGQVTRVFPFTSEVTLLTDKEQAIPVQLLRNGLRSVAYGRGKAGTLELRFTAPNADIQVGDIVVTSGLDGVYPAGLAVARVSQVENSAAGSFGGVICQPLGGISNHTQLLVLLSVPDMPPRPPDEEQRQPRKHNNKMGPIKDPAREADGNAAAAAAPAAAGAPAAVAGAGTAAAPAANNNGAPGLMPVMPAARPAPAPTGVTETATPATSTNALTGAPPGARAPAAAPAKAKEPVR